MAHMNNTMFLHDSTRPGNNMHHEIGNDILTPIALHTLMMWLWELAKRCQVWFFSECWIQCKKTNKFTPKKKKKKKKNM